MADLEFYKLSMTGQEADSGIRTGMAAGATSGVLLGDGNGGVSAATPGKDFGYPLLKGNGPPTANTAANIGQHYFDMAATQAPYEYICVGLNSNGFIWIVFGDTGNGFKISGYFSSVAALNAAIEEGKIEAPVAGVSYGIGEAPPYDIVTWDGVANDWKNNGPLGASGGGEGVPPHGTTGQVLTKLSDIDGDAGWKDVALKGKGAPTASTVGMIGQLYVDTTATENPAYICVGISTADNVTTCAWQPVGGSIQPESIGTPELAPGAVTTEKLAAGAVTADKIDPDAVGAIRELLRETMAEKILWNGSWNSGTLTVSGLSKYSLFRIGFAGQGTAALVVKSSNYLRGMGGYSSATPTILTYHFAATFEGETLSLVAANSLSHTPSAGHSSLESMTVVSIMGLI